MDKKLGVGARGRGRPIRQHRAQLVDSRSPKSPTIRPGSPRPSRVDVRRRREVGPRVTGHADRFAVGVRRAAAGTARALGLLVLLDPRRQGPRFRAARRGTDAAPRRVEISCAFPPNPAAVEHVVEAERLGYARAWLYDSPALYGDIWMIAALCATRTSRIGLGPGRARSESSPSAHAGECDRDARTARAGPGRGRDRHRIHGSHGDGAEAAHVGVHATLRRATARAAARRAGRGRRCARADVARGSSTRRSGRLPRRS